MYGCGIRSIKIYSVQRSSTLMQTHCHRALRCPLLSEAKVQVAVVGSGDGGCARTIQELLQAEPQVVDTESLPTEQQRDSELVEINYLERRELPSDPERASLIVLQSPLHTIVDNVLYYVNPKNTDWLRVVVPTHLKKELLEDYHRGRMGAYFWEPAVQGDESPMVVGMVVG